MDDDDSDGGDERGRERRGGGIEHSTAEARHSLMDGGGTWLHTEAVYGERGTRPAHPETQEKPDYPGFPHKVVQNIAIFGLFGTCCTP